MDVAAFIKALRATVVMIKQCLFKKKEPCYVGSKSAKSSGCQRALTQRKLENTQQRATGIFTEASVWASTAVKAISGNTFSSAITKTCSIPDFRTSIAASNHISHHGQALEKRFMQKFSSA